MITLFHFESPVFCRNSSKTFSPSRKSSRPKPSLMYSSRKLKVDAGSSRTWAFSRMTSQNPIAVPPKNFKSGAFSLTKVVTPALGHFHSKRSLYFSINICTACKISNLAKLPISSSLVFEFSSGKTFWTFGSSHTWLCLILNLNLPRC